MELYERSVTATHNYTTTLPYITLTPRLTFSKCKVHRLKNKFLNRLSIPTSAVDFLKTSALVTITGINAFVRLSLPIPIPFCSLLRPLLHPSRANSRRRIQELSTMRARRFVSPSSPLLMICTLTPSPCSRKLRRSTQPASFRRRDY